MRFVLRFFTAALCITVIGYEAAAQDLTGLWGATLRFGPDIRGPLLILQDAAGFRADIAGFSVRAVVRGDMISFELPDDKGKEYQSSIGQTESDYCTWVARLTRRPARSRHHAQSQT